MYAVQNSESGGNCFFVRFVNRYTYGNLRVPLLQNRLRAEKGEDGGRVRRCCKGPHLKWHRRTDRLFDCWL